MNYGFEKGPIAPYGALVDILVRPNAASVQSLQGAGLHVPQPVRIQALLDIGSDCTGIDEGVLLGLGLRPHGRFTVGSMTTGASKHPVNVFKVSLSLLLSPKPYTLDCLTVTAPDLTGFPFQAFLGRDVLNNGVVNYDGPKGEFTLEF